MKKNLLLIFSFVFFGTMAMGQSFLDDFESYDVGSYLGASASEWTTWSGNTGTTEDVRITDETASSGTNSIKFASTAANGGPQDVVLFYGGQKLTTGFLNTKMNMLVETGAYFNYQAEVAIGTTWAMNAFFDPGGTGRITGSGSDLILTFSYPEGEWFDFEMDINFDANKWQLKVNGVCVGSFASTTNSIASIDIYPIQGNSFFIDDFSYDYSATSPEILADISTELKTTYSEGISGSKIALGAALTNGGSTEINSVELEITVGTDTYPFLQDGLTLANGESVDIVIDEEFILPDGFTQLEVNVKSVNGGDFVDEDLCNDSSSLLLFGTTPGDHKKVVVEEATGTWCGWCPRGTVWMDRMTNKYPDHFIGIAVHNGDPMVDADYDTGLAASGFPNAVVNRGGFIDPASIESPFLDDVKETSIAIMEHGALWDETTRELTISLDVTALEDISTMHTINVAMTEDNVTGTASSFGQVNYYSGSQDLIDDNGMNWRDLPSTVPAADMVYDHVARAILAPWAGMPDSFKEDLPADSQKSFNFTYVIPESFDTEKMHIITMMINPDGTINTGESTSIAKAVENGFNFVTSVPSIALTNATNVYPNPMNEYATIDINLSQQTDIQVEVVDLAGKSIFRQTYDNRNGFFRTNLDTSNFPVGSYVIRISTDEFYTTKKISVVR